MRWHEIFEMTVKLVGMSLSLEASLLSTGPTVSCTCLPPCACVVGGRVRLRCDWARARARAVPVHCSPAECDRVRAASTMADVAAASSGIAVRGRGFHSDHASSFGGFVETSRGRRALQLSMHCLVS